MSYLIHSWKSSPRVRVRLTCQRPVMPGKFWRHFVTKDDAVRVTDRGRTILKGGARHVHMLSQHLAFVSDDRYLGAQKTYFSHFHSHYLSTTVNMTDYSSAKSLYRKRVLVHQALVPEIARKDAKAIPALFRFTAVRVQDPETKITRITVKRTEKNSIGPDAIVTVTNELNLPRGKVPADISWADY